MFTSSHLDGPPPDHLQCQFSTRADTFYFSLPQATSHESNLFTAHPKSTLPRAVSEYANQRWSTLQIWKSIAWPLWHLRLTLMCVEVLASDGCSVFFASLDTDVRKKTSFGNDLYCTENICASYRKSRSTYLSNPLTFSFPLLLPFQSLIAWIKDYSLVKEQSVTPWHWFVTSFGSIWTVLPLSSRTQPVNEYCFVTRSVRMIFYTSSLTGQMDHVHTQN